MINGKEVDKKCCNYCTKNFSATTSSGNLKGHLNVHDLLKKRHLPLIKFMKVIKHCCYFVFYLLFLFLLLVVILLSFFIC